MLSAKFILSLSILTCPITLSLSALVATNIDASFAGAIQRPSRKSSPGQRISPTKKRIVIAASTVLDGKGSVLRNTRIVIEGSKIVAIDPKIGPVDYDLRGLTVLPGRAGTPVRFQF